MVLILSNGHGEDCIGTMVARALLALRPGLDIAAFPLVGLGGQYAAAGIRVVGAQKTMPSGGFARHGARLLARDLRAGLLGLTARQVAHMRALRHAVRIAVCVGDMYPVLLAGAFVRRPVLLLSTAKSEYIRGHSAADRWIMRRLCGLVLARDALTAQALARGGVNARYVGNVMMDALTVSGDRFGPGPGRKVVGILPGSREEAYGNVVDILRVVDSLASSTGSALDFVLALAPGLSVEALSRAVQAAGWRCAPPAQREVASGVVGRLVPPGADDPQVIVMQGRFGDVLSASDVVIGLAGTGNEQAAGLGKPVVAFPGRGPQFTAKFARAQKRLLGEALALVESGDPDEVAYEVTDILRDGVRAAEMRRAGIERMGEQGGALRTAKIILDYLDRSEWEG